MTGFIDHSLKLDSSLMPSKALIFTSGALMTGKRLTMSKSAMADCSP